VLLTLFSFTSNATQGVRGLVREADSESGTTALKDISMKFTAEDSVWAVYQLTTFHQSARKITKPF